MSQQDDMTDRDQVSREPQLQSQVLEHGTDMHGSNMIELSNT